MAEHGEKVVTNWRKSSHSSESANCVEILEQPDQVWLRDSKDPNGPFLTVSTQAWTDLILGIKDGEFDQRH